MKWNNKEFTRLMAYSIAIASLALWTFYFGGLAFRGYEKYTLYEPNPVMALSEFNLFLMGLVMIILMMIEDVFK